MGLSTRQYTEYVGISKEAIWETLKYDDFYPFKELDFSGNEALENFYRALDEQAIKLGCEVNLNTGKVSILSINGNTLKYPVNVR